MSQNLIGQIVTSKSPLRPGESCEVEVRDADGKEYDGKKITIRINGLIGSKQVFQFRKSGTVRLLIQATARDGRRERQTVEIEIAGEPVEYMHQGRKQLAVLQFAPVLARPYEMKIGLGRLAEPPASYSLTAGLKAKIAETTTVDLKSAKQLFAKSGTLSRAISGALNRVETTAPIKMTMPANSKRKSNKFFRTVVFGLDHRPKAIRPKEEYIWDFGDGVKVRTHIPMVSHDFFAGMDHRQESTLFVLSCHVIHSNVTVRRSVVVNSPYAISKRQGYVVPHVSADIFAHKRYNRFTASMVVHNVEAQTIMLEQVAFTSDATAHSVAHTNHFVRLGQPLSIAAGTKALININVPFVNGAGDGSSLPFDVTGFKVIYAGTSAGLPVRVNASFDIPLTEQSWLPPSIRPEIDPEIIPGVTIPHKVWPWEKWSVEIGRHLERRLEAATTLNKTPVVLEQVSGTVLVSLGKIAATTKAGLIIESIPVHSARDARLQRQVANRMVETFRTLTFEKGLEDLLNGTIVGFGGSGSAGLVAEGQSCDPSNIGTADSEAADRAQLVCQITDEVTDVFMPARWMNAHRGDIILSPGGDGLIGGMMTMVDPAQWYSHCGIMTQNYQEIAHSTGSQDRIQDCLVGTFDGSDGIEPSALKYVWPGAIVQTIDQSIFSYNEADLFQAPPNPKASGQTEPLKKYKLNPFGRHTKGFKLDGSMIPPLVIKPDPLLETPAVRKTLQALADDCFRDAGTTNHTGKYHYRWYCYTDPSIGINQPAGPNEGWASGTLPSVCSSFIWLHARARNIHLESDTEFVAESDIETSDAGARVRATTRNGLYAYTAAERLAAGEYLYNAVHYLAFDKAGWAATFFSDAPDDTANQFLNAFGSDDADGRDSDDWRDAKPADAVSPDDMLWWDGPDRGGVYGYSEVAIFREPRWERQTVSKWTLVRTRGTVRGRVLAADGSPAAGVRVEMTTDVLWDLTDTAGNYLIESVPFGRYQITARKVIDNILQSVAQPVTLEVVALSLDLQLNLPEERYRVAQITVDFYGIDEESDAENKVENPSPTYFELELGPDKLINVETLSYPWGGELRAKYDITARWLGNNVIDIDVQARLYEGTSEKSDDLDGIGNVAFQIWPEKTEGSTITITNTDEEDGDKAILNLVVHNARNDN